MQEEPPHKGDINADAQATEVARENQAQEESMTIDEIPELVKMMTEIQAALTEPEGSIEGEQPAEGPTEGRLIKFTPFSLPLQRLLSGAEVSQSFGPLSEQDCSPDS